MNLLSSLSPDDLKDKRVLLRLDLDVPLKEHKTKDSKLTKEVGDDNRLEQNLPTVEYLLKHSKEVIIMGHLGRPEGIDKKYSLEPVALWFYHKLKTEDTKQAIQYQQIGQFWGWRITDKLFLLENLRFYEEEEKNETKFAKLLADLGDIYVNDSFAVSHRNHASLAGIPQFLPHYAGLRLQKEVETLSLVMENPKRPLVVLIGGAKIETKLPVVTKMHEVADYVLVGGKIAQNHKELLVEQHRKMPHKTSVLEVADLNEAKTDITEESAENFLQILGLAKTIIWNGPVGFIDSDNEKDQEGTKIIAEGIVKMDAFKVVGGGDTIGFLRKLHLLKQFDFVSTGGGAMLEFLSGEKLPGIEALR